MSAKTLLALWGLKWNPFTPELPRDALWVTPRPTAIVSSAPTYSGTSRKKILFGTNLARHFLDRLTHSDPPRGTETLLACASGHIHVVHEPVGEPLGRLLSK